MGAASHSMAMKHRPVSPGSQPGGPMHDFFWRMGDAREGAGDDQLWQLMSLGEAAKAAALSAFTLPDPPPSRPR